MKPTILTPWDFSGAHGKRIEVAENKIIKNQYADQSILALVPTRTFQAGLSPKWVAAANSLMKPMNQKFAGPGFICGMEVGEAYNTAVQMVTQDEKYRTFKYLLTWEDDVIPEPDALVEMLSVAVETDADVVCALYWSKGPAGFPMVYGDISEPINFRVMHPNEERYRWCYGTGMGFTLFKTDQFEKYFPGQTDEWFKTSAVFDEDKREIRAYTQDLYYMEKLIRAGGKICVAQEARCGHYDAKEDVLW